AHPMFKEPKRYPELADPLLEGDFPVRGLNQAVAVAAMCLQEEAQVRPLISDVVTALSFLSVGPIKDGSSTPDPLPHPEEEEDDDKERRDEESSEERQRAVAEAIEWGANTREENKRSHG
ncbi:hypothetical protein MKX03_013024, partial [Papaver bracteatum]